MSNDTLAKPKIPTWKMALGIGFAIIWSIVGPILSSVEGQRPFEEVPEFAGRVMGQGIAIGLVAALIAHFAILRHAGRKVKVLNYLVAIVVGAATSWLVHGG